MATDQIVIKGAREHNLKNLDVVLPRDRLVVITGLSGSGKSSLAFDTIYAEGQRRYVESLSAYARQFLEQMSKPDIDSIEGLSPAISIEQKTTSKNPRSTVGTVTEIYDYLRLLYARAGTPHCYRCGQPIASQTAQQIVDQVLDLPPGTKLSVLAPVVRGRKGEYRKELKQYARDGFVRVRIDGEVRELTDEIVLDKNKKHDIDLYVDRLVNKAGIRQRLADSVELALRLGEGLVTIAVHGGEEFLCSERFACIDCGISYPELEPRSFSFNNPHGACPTCSGLGTISYFDPDRVVPDPALSLEEGAILPWSGRTSRYNIQMLRAVVAHYGASPEAPFQELPDQVRQVLLYGSGKERIRFEFEGDDRRYNFTRHFEGVIPNLERRLRETQSEAVREEFDRYQSHRPCSECGGARLRQEARHVKVAGKAIHEVCALSIRQALAFFQNLSLPARQAEIADRVLREIRERLGFLVSVGLDYLSLDRASGTLSGGEGQRIRLATQIGSSLVGVLYILDEPSIGLHQRDNERLLATMMHLRDLGNTVVVVEHDRDTMLAADHLVDMGPGAGVHGGYIVAQGTPQEILAHPESLTGRYLAGTEEIPTPQQRREPRPEAVVVEGARANNLKDQTVTFPLGVLTCVTGVSGSGKSTLVNDTLYAALSRHLYRSRHAVGVHRAIRGLEHIDKVIDIDQSPIGRTPRSNPATYTGVFTQIRDLFAQLPESKVRGYGPGRYSFNVKGGRCEACQGDGILRIEMHFLPDIFVTCEECGGRRYNRETLEIAFRGKTIADVLEMTVSEALEFFSNQTSIRNKLQTLEDVGLGYITLGQQATTLSGGEAQRVKLAKELSKRATGRTLYILDEPTTGLHFHDIRKLLEVLNRLVEGGNTVVVIEHNLDVIKSADYLIDLGPEGGEGGGRVIATGTPEEVAHVAESHTGRFLRALLEEEGQSHRAAS